MAPRWKMVSFVFNLGTNTMLVVVFTKNGCFDPLIFRPKKGCFKFFFFFILKIIIISESSHLMGAKCPRNNTYPSTKSYITMTWIQRKAYHGTTCSCRVSSTSRWCGYNDSITLHLKKWYSLLNAWQCHKLIFSYYIKV